MQHLALKIWENCIFFFLGIEVNYLSGGIVLSQNKFTENLLKEHTPDEKRKSLTPLPIQLKLSSQGGKLLEDPTPYRSIVGKLKYLTNTRPDLSYAVQNLSRFMQNPTDLH